MPLNKPQQIAVETYSGGKFGHISTVEEAENVLSEITEDALFLFIMRELSDEEDCSIEEAIGRLNRSQADIQGVLDGLEGVLLRSALDFVAKETK